MSVAIYSLSDGEVRYIGQTSHLDNRLRQHLCPSELRRGRHKANWLRSLLKENHRPVFRVILLCEREVANRYETAVIVLYKRRGARLTNLTAGGGESGKRPLGRIPWNKGKTWARTYKHTLETKQKIAAKLKGNKNSAGRKRVHSLETRRRLSESHKGKSANNVHLIEFCGVRLPIVEWSRRTGVPSTTLRGRLSAGWSVERALNTPRRGKENE